MFEIQIRTREMHDLAETASPPTGATRTTPRPGRGRRTGACTGSGRWRPSSRRTRTAGVPAEPQDNLIPEEVYVFTPGARSSTCRPGPRPRFAFKIHTESGSRVRARINGTSAPLKTALKTGDIVEVLTAPDRRRRAACSPPPPRPGPASTQALAHLRSRTTSAALGRKIWTARSGSTSAARIPPRGGRGPAPGRRRRPAAATMDEFTRQVGLGRIVVDPKLMEASSARSRRAGPPSSARPRQASPGQGLRSRTSTADDQSWPSAVRPSRRARGRIHHRRPGIDGPFLRCRS